MESFAPSILIGNITYIPPGWMWVLAFAKVGCEWAIEECESKNFKEQIKEYKNQQIKESIDHHLKEISRLKAELL
jgi:hypothetical protein